MFVAVAALAVVIGAPLEAQADPNAVGYVPRPEWYFLDLFQLLWYVSGPAEPLVVFAIATLGVCMFLLLPFYDRSRQRHPRRRPIATAAGVAAVLAVAVLTYQGATAPTPSTGSATLASSASLTAVQRSGLRVYQVEGCASCHTIAGSGGSMGPDLTHVASRLTAPEIQQQILHPRAKMPAYTDISPPDMSNLLDFLATLR